MVVVAVYCGGVFRLFVVVIVLVVVVLLLVVVVSDG